MTSYYYCNHRIESNLLINELPPFSKKDLVEISFSLDEPFKVANYSHWSNQWVTQAGETALQHRKTGQSHLLRFQNSTDFLLSPNDLKIQCHPSPTATEDTIERQLLNQVLPRFLAYRGQIMLHASAVLLDSGLLLFVGDSGSGKSTLAAAFHQGGFKAMADDCVYLQEGADGSVVAVPCYPGLRLWEDSFCRFFNPKEEQPVTGSASKRKIPLEAGNYSFIDYCKGIPVTAVISLLPLNRTTEQPIDLHILSPRDAFMELVKQTFLLDFDDSVHIGSIILSLGRIAPSLPTWQLVMPRDYSLIPDVIDLIVRRVRFDA